MCFNLWFCFLFLDLAFSHYKIVKILQIYSALHRYPSWHCPSGSLFRQLATVYYFLDYFLLCVLLSLSGAIISISVLLKFNWRQWQVSHLLMADKNSSRYDNLAKHKVVYKYHKYWRFCQWNRRKSNVTLTQTAHIHYPHTSTLLHCHLCQMQLSEPAAVELCIFQSTSFERFRSEVIVECIFQKPDWKTSYKLWSSKK